jgi:hypothetical protein
MNKRAFARKLREISRNVHDINHVYKSGEEFWYLLTADRHWDNPDSDWDLQIKHLKEARERNAMVIDVGDFFCLMQGKYDKRSDKSKVRPEHQKTNYLDSVVETGADFFEPYQDLFAVIGQGNHETSILKYHETNISERFVERLNYKKEHKVFLGGYTGYIRLSYEGQAGGSRNSLLLHYNHGWGGGGPVTKGVIQSQRQAVYNPDPDVIISGHIHENYVFPIEQIRMNQKGVLYQRTQYHVRLPTYKNEYKDGYGGWHIETGKPPKPIGGMWMRVKVTRHGKGIKTFLQVDFLQAR